jgi:hypothetical protein
VAGAQFAPVAVRHAGGLLQLTGAVVWVQVPPWQVETPLQKLPSSQLVPVETLMPVSVQTGTPVAQEMLPTWQGLVGAQPSPPLQETQVPALHTMLLPQLVPSGALPVSEQVDAPVAQEVRPEWQGLAGVQAAPAVQATQEPVRQTWFVPQEVPLAAVGCRQAPALQASVVHRFPSSGQPVPLERFVQPSPLADLQFWQGLFGLAAPSA